MSQARTSAQCQKQRQTLRKLVGGAEATFSLAGWNQPANTTTIQARHTNHKDVAAGLFLPAADAGTVRGTILSQKPKGHKNHNERPALQQMDEDPQSREIVKERRETSSNRRNFACSPWHKLLGFFVRLWLSSTYPQESVPQIHRTSWLDSSGGTVVETDAVGGSK